MPWFHRKPPLRPIEELYIESEMLDQGWRFWPPDATPEEQLEARKAYRRGDRPDWYPPGSQVQEVDYSGEKIYE